MLARWPAVKPVMEGRLDALMFMCTLMLSPMPKPPADASEPTLAWDRSMTELAPPSPRGDAPWGRTERTAMPSIKRQGKGT